MKLDKIRFARLMALISEEYQKFDGLGFEAIQRIDDLIDVEVPVGKASVDDVDAMLKSIAMGEKIASIKHYRYLTGAGLKESKDAIEAYWLRQPPVAFPPKQPDPDYYNANENPVRNAN